MKLADFTYRTTYGRDYGYNERFGVKDSNETQGTHNQFSSIIEPRVP
jgi:hypothetical protein